MLIHTPPGSPPAPLCSLLHCEHWKVMRKKRKRAFFFLLFNTCDLLSDLSTFLLGLFIFLSMEILCSAESWSVQVLSTEPVSYDLIYLVRKELKKVGKAVSLQSIHQRKGQFPLETGVILIRACKCTTVVIRTKKWKSSSESNVSHIYRIQKSKDTKLQFFIALKKFPKHWLCFSKHTGVSVKYCSSLLFQTK